MKAHDTSDRGAASNLTLPREDEKIAYGLFYQDEAPKSYDAQDATRLRGHHPVKAVKPRDVTKLIEAIKQSRAGGPFD